MRAVAPWAHDEPWTNDEPAAVQRRRRRVVAGAGVVGAGLLGLSLSSQPASRRFYVLTFSAAATWGTSAIASGPLHRGWTKARPGGTRRRPIVVPVAVGVGAFGVFYGCALVARRVPLLDAAIVGVMRFARQGSTPLVVLTTCANGVAEELFFRGALYAAVGSRHPVAKATAAYTAVTAATRNPALTIAGALMGTLFGLQRRATGGVQAPIITHVTWSALMLRYLPPLFPSAGRRPQA
jgi:membrane protease YdiL (CAAX protease family)